MAFNEFERLEQFSLLANKIKKLNIGKNQPSSNNPTEKKSSGLVIKNDGSFKRS